jgi:hypothetical protein
MFVIFITFLQTTVFMINGLSYINFKLQCFLSLQSNNIRFTSSYPKHNGHLLLSTFRLIPLICHIPANTHSIPLLSFLEQYSMYNFLPKETLNSLYSVFMTCDCGAEEHEGTI